MAYYKCGSVHPTQNSNVVVDTAFGAIANFQTPLAMPLKSLEVDVNAMQKAGTPTPQSPKAISGVSAVSVIHRGFNLFDKTTVVNGEYINDTDGTARLDANSKRSDFIEIAPDTNYYIKSEQTQGNWGAWYDVNKNFILGINGYNTVRHSPVNARYVRLTCYRGGSGNIDTFCFNVSDASKNGQHEAYNNASSTTLINLGGTYYGGKLTQDNAGHRQFEVTHEIIDLGEPNWSYATWGAGPVFSMNLPLAKEQPNAGLKGDITCSVYKNITSSEMYNDNSNYSICLNRANIRIANSDYTDRETFKAAMTGQKLVYELATPYTIDLPDGEPIITLNGINNIYADTGDTSLQFRKIG